jgi:hypothetical protein
MPAGRPSEYKPEYCQDIKQFFDLKRIEGMPPWLDDYAEKIGVSHQTLLTWTKANSEFLEAYSYCKKIQENMIAENALIGKFNASFAFNALKNVAGWRDHNDLNIGGQQDNRLEISVSYAPEKPKE